MHAVSMIGMKQPHQLKKWIVAKMANALNQDMTELIVAKKKPALWTAAKMVNAQKKDTLEAIAARSLNHY